MMNNEDVERIKGRIQDCDVVLVGDKWKENYKQDVPLMAGGLMQLQAQTQGLAQVINSQASVLDFLINKMEEIKAATDNASKSSAIRVNQISKDVLDQINKLLEQQNA